GAYHAVRPVWPRGPGIQLLPAPLLPQMPWRRPSHMARGSEARGARDALRPCRLYPAAYSGAPGAAESTPPVWLTLSHGRPNASGHRRGPDASRGGDRRLRRAPHVEPTTPPSPPPALCPAGGWLRPGWHAVDAVSTALFSACPRPLATLPTPLPRGAGADLRAGPALLHGALSGARCAHALAPVPHRGAGHGMGRVRESTAPGAPARPHVPGPLCPPHRYLQPPAR